MSFWCSKMKRQMTAILFLVSLSMALSFEKNYCSSGGELMILNWKRLMTIVLQMAEVKLLSFAILWSIRKSSANILLFNSGHFWISAFTISTFSFVFWMSTFGCKLSWLTINKANTELQKTDLSVPRNQWLFQYTQKVIQNEGNSPRIAFGKQTVEPLVIL